jgi:hypothetical protein
MTDIVQQLLDHTQNDHTRGCEGRNYSCSCGYDRQTETLMMIAAVEIDKLESMLYAQEDVAPLYAEIKRLRAVLTDLRDRAREEGIPHFVKLADAALLTTPAAGDATSR